MCVYKLCIILPIQLSYTARYHIKTSLLEFHKRHGWHLSVKSAQSTIVSATRSFRQTSKRQGHNGHSSIMQTKQLIDEDGVLMKFADKG